MPPADPHSPAPDVSPRLMNPALPKIGKSMSSRERPSRRQGQKGEGETLLDWATQILANQDKGYYEPAEDESRLLGSSSLPLPMPKYDSATPTIRAHRYHPSSGAHQALQPLSDLPPSTTSAPANLPGQPTLTLALEKIQTSLSALHERLAALEYASTIQHQRSHPLTSLLLLPFNRDLSPFSDNTWSLSKSTSKGKRTKALHLLWSLFKKVVGDVAFVAMCFTVYVALKSGNGRRNEIRLFWVGFWNALRRNHGLGAIGAGVTGLGLRVGARELQMEGASSA